MKRKIRIGAIIICIVILVGLSIRDAVAIYSFKSSANKESGSESSYELMFEGKISLKDIDYDVKLKGNENTFTVLANDMTVTDGSYEFTEGQGYTFKFNDSNSTIVRTQFDDKDKKFGFVYHIDMGEARGNGNVKLTMQDEKFKVDGEAWEDIPLFSGNAEWFDGKVTATVNIICDEQGKFHTVSPNDDGLDTISGTYEYTGDGCVFTLDDGTQYTAEKNADGNLEVVLPIIKPSLAEYGAELAETTFTQVIYTEDK